jgi:methanogenic corrinoid protein MtbC1
MPDYALMNQYLYEGKAKEVEQMTKDALAEGRHFQEVLTDGLIAGMSVVGEDFKHNILYVPEVLIAARAMKAGMAVLKPLLTAGGGSNRVGTLLMGTVRGDLHDIGKNLVCMMAEGAGFEVHDIGVDQSVEKFMAAADKVNPDIIGMSALLTTTMTYMKTVIDGFHAAGRDKIKFAVGGAPISQMFADEVGADGYGQNASAAVDLFIRLASGAPGTAAAPTPSPAAPGEGGGEGQPTREGKLTTYKILYWQEIPSQIKAEDDAGNEVSIELGQKVTEHIDAEAQKRGFTDGERYTAQWKWSDEQERPGSAPQVVEKLKAELLAQLKL